jgi:hypothetical protein
MYLRPTGTRNRRCEAKQTRVIRRWVLEFVGAVNNSTDMAFAKTGLQT